MRPTLLSTQNNSFWSSSSYTSAAQEIIQVFFFFFFNENNTRFVYLESDSLPGIPGGSASHQWLRSITLNYTNTTNRVLRSRTLRIMVWRRGRSSFQQNKHLAGETYFFLKSLKGIHQMETFIQDNLLSLKAESGIWNPVFSPPGSLVFSVVEALP